jgi:hypothetical protein
VNILLDHCVPRRFGRQLTGHAVRTAFEIGWSGLSNGVLLGEAARQFDAFIIVDQNVQFQQNLATLPLPMAIIVASDNRFETLLAYVPAILKWLTEPLPVERVHIETPTQVTRVGP